MPFRDLDIQQKNAGEDFFQDPNSPDDILRFWRSGDAFPRLIIRMTGATGEIKVGNGTAFPSADVPASAIVDPDQLEPGGLTPIEWYGVIHIFDLLINRPAAGPTNEGSLFFGSDNGIIYLSDGATWTAVADLGGGAPATVDYLVGTASGGLSNEIVVGTTPNGELGGAWGAITVDAVHSGSSHSEIDDNAIAYALALG